jgi:hypothetical protein
MMEALPIAGLFILACTFQDVDPILNTPIGKPHPASLVARDGTGTMIAWSEIDGDRRVSVRKDDTGIVTLAGLRFRSNGEETWAILKPQDDKNFAVEWLGYNQVANDGRQTTYVWSHGTCERIGSTPPKD